MCRKVKIFAVPQKNGGCMAFVKRIFLFLLINFLVVLTISILLNFFHVQPYLNQYGIQYRELLIFSLIWGMGGAFISLALSRFMAKTLLGIKVIDPQTNDPELKSLLHLVHDLARKANLPKMPEVGIYQSPEVNAFATGPTKRSSLVAVSSGLLQQMNPEQLEGVLAHEITHISNGDMVTMTLLQGIVNAFVIFLARVLALIFSGFGKGENKRGSYGSFMVFTFIFEVVFMLLGSMVIFWFSRRREYRADHGGAQLAGKKKMISALEGLMSTIKRRDPHAEKEALAAFKISTPSKSGWALLFSSHPPLEMRIAKLRSETL